MECENATLLQPPRVCHRLSRHAIHRLGSLTIFHWRDEKAAGGSNAPHALHCFVSSPLPPQPPPTPVAAAAAALLSLLLPSPPKPVVGCGHAGCVAPTLQPVAACAGCVVSKPPTVVNCRLAGCVPCEGVPNADAGAPNAGAGPPNAGAPNAGAELPNPPNAGAATPNGDEAGAPPPPDLWVHCSSSSDLVCAGRMIHARM